LVDNVYTTPKKKRKERKKGKKERKEKKKRSKKTKVNLLPLKGQLLVPMVYVPKLPQHLSACPLWLLRAFV
jgi:hypothetical protein